MRIDVERVNWFSTYRVHHRVAEPVPARARLPARRRRAHPQPGRRPGDEHRHRRRGQPGLEARRRAARARRRRRCSTPTSPSASPSRAGWSRPPTAPSPSSRAAAPLARCVRMRVVPRAAAAPVRLTAVRRLMFRTVSQTDDQLPRQRAQRRAQAGRCAAATGCRGCRSRRRRGDNFAPLASLDWQVHVYGEGTAALAAACGARGVALHVFPWRDSHAPGRARAQTRSIWCGPTATSRSADPAKAARSRSRPISTRAASPGWRAARERARSGGAAASAASARAPIACA